MAEYIRKKVFFGVEAGIFRNMVGDVILDKNYEFCSFGEKKQSRLKNFIISKKAICRIPTFAKKVYI